MSGDPIDRLVDRFLGWKLPPTFSPDCFIAFDSARAAQAKAWPIGTNLLTAVEARAMFAYVLDGMLDAPADAWHEAVLGECMAVESRYVIDDPARTLANLIDWHVQNARGASDNDPLAAPRSPGHIVVELDSGRFLCTHCGDSYGMALPCPVDVYVACSKAFADLHAHCRPRAMPPAGNTAVPAPGAP